MGCHNNKWWYKMIPTTTAATTNSTRRIIATSSVSLFVRRICCSVNPVIVVTVGMRNLVTTSYSHQRKVRSGMRLSHTTVTRSSCRQCFSSGGGGGGSEGPLVVAMKRRQLYHNNNHYISCVSIRSLPFTTSNMTTTTTTTIINEDDSVITTTIHPISTNDHVIDSTTTVDHNNQHHNNNDDDDEHYYPKLPTTLPSFTTTEATNNTNENNNDKHNPPTDDTTTNNDDSSSSSQQQQQQQQQYNLNPKPIMVHLTSNLQDAISEQKKRAIAVWEGVLRYGTFPSDSHTHTDTLPTSISYNDAMYIQQQLKEGYVLPSFHAYTISEEQRLFNPYLLIHTGLSIVGGTHQNPSDTPIRLTCQPVKAGQCYGHDDITISTYTTSSKSRDIVPYCVPLLPPTTSCTSEHPSENKDNYDRADRATVSFECDYMTTFIDPKTKLAREHVYDPGYINENDGWTYSTQYTKEIVHLINTPAEMIGEDVEVTPLLSNFGIQPTQNDCNHTSYGTSMITRRLSRGIVLDCFRNLQKPSRTLAITGNRGIGKSYTLIFALQQALLYDKMCVILFLQKEQKAILCIRNQEHVYAWEGTTIHPMTTSSLFTNPNVFVLIDPIDADDGGINYAIGARRLIYAASNHDQHFNKPLPVKISHHHKPAQWTIPHKQRFLSPYTEDELRIALPYMLNVNNTTFDEAMQRTYDVGMIPKYILNDVDYQTRKAQVEEYVQLLQSSSNEMEQLLHWNGMIGVAENMQPPAAEILSDTIQSKDSELETDDMIDDTFEVDGIVIGRIGSPKRVMAENPMAPKQIPKSPPKPGKTAFYKMGIPLSNVDGTMILSLNALEMFDRANPISTKSSRSSSNLIGYNGHRHVRYNDPKMTITCPKIYDTIVQHYMKVNPSYIVTLWDKVGSGYHNGMNTCVADLFWEFILHQRAKADRIEIKSNATTTTTTTTTGINPVLMAQRKLLYPWSSYKLIKGKENKNPLSEWVVPITMKGRRVYIDRTRRYSLNELKVVFQMKKNITPKLVRMDTSTQNIIHFAGPGRVVYQIVNDDDYNLHFLDMVKILVYGKYLLRQQKITKHHGAIVCAPNPPIQKLEWYFIVPNTKAAVKWEQRSPAYYELEQIQNETTEQRTERRIMNRNKEAVNACMKYNIIQRVLVMDFENYDLLEQINNNNTRSQPNISDTNEELLEDCIDE